jgi:hypothetical protein
MSCGRSLVGAALWRGKIVMLAAALVCLGWCHSSRADSSVAKAVASAPSASEATAFHRSGAPALRARVVLSRGSQRVPRSFLGISVESNELLSYVHEGRVFDRVLGLIRGASGAPLALRVGGRSGDDAYWNASTAHDPSWTFAIGHRWLDQLAALARRDELQVTLDLNLAVHSPAMEARFAKAALHALGRSRLIGLAIGNEPDLYGHQSGLAHERISTTMRSARGQWTRGYSPAHYRADFLAYARRLSRAAPRIPLEGPEVAAANPSWLHTLGGLGRLGPRAISVHRYPFSYCWPPSSPIYPTVSRLLSLRATRSLAGRLLGVIRYAHRSGKALQVSEINSVSCGGNPGVSNTFASALWTPDVLFDLMRVGVNGVNWHMRSELLNAPFLLKRGSIRVLPELYGLTLFAQMIGTNARLVRLHESARGLNLSTWAVRSNSGTSVLLINKGHRAAEVTISSKRHATRSAHVERLWGQSALSASGVTLGGRRIGADGRWHSRQRIVTVLLKAGRYKIRVAGFSAALLQAPQL